MAKFKVPVEWTVCDMVEVEAESFKEAIKYVLENRDEIPLGTEPDYIDGTYKINSEDEISGDWNNIELDVDEYAAKLVYLLESFGYGNAEDFADKEKEYSELAEYEHENFEELEAFVNEQLQVLVDAGEITENDSNYISLTSLAEVTKKYLDECNAFEAENKRDLLLSEELEIMHRVIYNAVKEISFVFSLKSITFIKIFFCNFRKRS